MFANLGAVGEAGVEILAQGVFGDVVFGGTESAGEEHDVGALLRLSEGGTDLFGVVVNGGDLTDYVAPFVEACRHPGAVGVDDLADEEFVADGDYFCLFHFFSSG